MESDKNDHLYFAENQLFYFAPLVTKYLIQF
jgi:hypothetical protein